MKYSRAVPRDYLIKEAQKQGILLKTSWSNTEIWKKLPLKSRRKLHETFCTIRGKGLERAIGQWLQRKFECKDIFFNQKIKGKDREHEVDVIGIKPSVFGGKCYLVESKGRKVSINDITLSGTIRKFNDILKHSSELPEEKFGGRTITNFMVVSSSGFTPTAKKLAKEKTLSGGFFSEEYELELYRFFGGKFEKLT